MIALPGDVVVDASVGIKLAMHENDSEKVRRLFAESLLGDCRSILVPDLFYIECGNILWKVVRRGDYIQEKAEEDIVMLQKLHLNVTPTRDLSERALAIACLHDITAYDGCYVALSERMAVPLLTADNRLASALAGGSFPVITLDNLQV